MKHPVKFFTVLFLVLTAVATAVIMTIRYMDVLQKQFDFLRSLLARRNAEASRDGEFSEEYGAASEEDNDASYSDSDYGGDELKF